MIIPNTYVGLLFKFITGIIIIISLIIGFSVCYWEICLFFPTVMSLLTVDVIKLTYSVTCSLIMNKSKFMHNILYLHKKNEIYYIYQTFTYVHKMNCNYYCSIFNTR